jgi:DNA-binding NtrC family response regulator
LGVRSLLNHEEYQLATCDDGAGLLEGLMARRPDAVVYVVRPDCPQDLAVLQLLRRMAPALPIVVLSHQASLDLRRTVQNMRPIYYADVPVDATEIRAAVHSALARRSTAAGA